MTAPYRWLRAAHEIAPNGAWFHAISCYRLGSKEGSRPLPTNCRKTGNYRLNACFRQVCRGRIDASRAVFPLGRFAGVAAAGGIYAAPTRQTIIFIIIYGRGRGVPRPYRAVYLYCPVGRGDLTPPESLPLGGKVARNAPDEGDLSGSCPLISHMR